MSEGTVFQVEAENGVTGLVLIGRGDLRFSPAPATEKGSCEFLLKRDAQHDVRHRFRAAQPVRVRRARDGNEPVSSSRERAAAATGAGALCARGTTIVQPRLERVESR
jgi:hypothetical protein